VAAAGRQGSGVRGEGSAGHEMQMCNKNETKAKTNTNAKRGKTK